MKLFNIKIEIHWSLWLIILLFCITDLISIGFISIFQNLFFWFIILFCLIGHELSHSLCARFFGYNTKKIVMNLFGGVALIELPPILEPDEEIMIASAGPAFNLALGIPSLFILNLFPNGIFLISSGNAFEFTKAGMALGIFCVANLMMGFFNLLPIFPMDGGRILKALLRAFYPDDSSKKISQFISMITISCFILFSIWFNFPFLILFGILLAVFTILEISNKISVR